MNKTDLIFLQNAIENELYLDSKFNSLNNIRKVKISKKLPKFQARLNAYNLYGNFYLIFELFISKFYYVLSLFLLQYIFLKSFILKILSRKKNIDCAHLFFINSPVAAGLAKNFILVNKISLAECSFFLLNKDHIKYLDNDCKYFYSNEILDYQSLLACFYFTFKAFFLFESKLKLYNFLYYNWLVQLETLRNINYNCFHSFDHYDRYAILADSQVYLKNKGSVEYFLHQHGKFNNIDNEFSIPYKLKNISHLVLFDNNDSLHFLQKNVIDRDCIINTISVLDDYFITIKNFNEKRFKILIIGNLACYQLHRRFIKSLENNPNIIFYYKPHPNKIVYMDNLNNCINIKDIQYFPDVDFVVSYDSTLLDEYIKLGYFCVKHSLDEIDEYKLKEKLNKFYHECNY